MNRTSKVLVSAFSLSILFGEIAVPTALAAKPNAAEQVFARGDSRAAVSEESACNGGDAHACAALGTMYVAGEGTSLDYARGLELLRKGCSGGSADACLGLHSLGERE
jgi:TPR repeat protein